MLRVSVEAAGLRDLQGRFQRLADTGANEAVAEGVREITERVYQQAKANIRSLFNTSGKMENALQMTVHEAGGRTIGTVSIEGIGYVTQELGGRGPFAIFPRNRLALAFEGEAGQTFASVVLHPPLPARSYLRKALDDVNREVGDVFREVIRARMIQR